MDCQPTGIPTQPTPGRHRCHCGVEVHPMPTPDLSDWQYADSDGRTTVDTAPPGLRENPRQWWDRLAAVNIETYSTLLAASQLGHLWWYHRHYPAKLIKLGTPATMWCCGQPMFAAPSGWKCRVRRTTTVPYPEPATI